MYSRNICDERESNKKGDGETKYYTLRREISKSASKMEGCCVLGIYSRESRSDFIKGWE